MSPQTNDALLIIGALAGGVQALVSFVSASRPTRLICNWGVAVTLTLLAVFVPLPIVWVVALAGLAGVFALTAIQRTWTEATAVAVTWLRGITGRAHQDPSLPDPAVRALGVAAGPSTPPASRRIAAERSAQFLATMLHRRWFPGASAGMDPDYRVSIFVPRPSSGAVEEWCCIARTGTRPSGKCWPHDPANVAHGGIVSATAIDREGHNVAGVPVGDREKEAVVDAYLQRSHITSQQQAQRSWKWASLKTCLSVSDVGTISCILVVERESGEPIVALGREYKLAVPGKKSRSLDVCHEELALVAQVWALAWEAA